MNKRQQKEYDKISKFLEQFGAKIKEGIEYIHANTKIIIINKFNVEKTITAYSVKRLSDSKFWLLGGGMNKVQQKCYDKINTILAQFEAKIKDREMYTNSEDNIIIVNKYNIEKTIIAHNIKRMTSKNDFWNFDGKSDDRQKTQLEKIRKIAQSKGGKLISTEYVNGQTKMEFIDKAGYTFILSGNSLLSGHWSAYEAKRSKDSEYHLKELRAIAESKGGQLLSTKYIGGKSKLQFSDSEDRIFFARSDQIKGGNWSPFEAGRGFSDDYHLKKLKEIADKRGGKIISTEYINSRTKLECEDRTGERFWATSHSLKKGQWSPFEGQGISEEIARQCLEYIFNQKFIRTRAVLLREGKMPLELDGYNQKLNMAFEYQGEQHYGVKSIISQNKNKEDILKRIQNNDKEKLELCKQKNIILILIKYFPKFKFENQYFEYILNIIKNHKDYNIFKNYIKNIDMNNFNIDYKKIPNSNDKLIEIENIAKSNNGKLISKKYINNQTKLEFEDESGLRFFKTYAQLLKGSWHKETRQYGKQYYLERIRQIAESKGGKLISVECCNRDTILELEDRNGKQFFKKYDHLVQGAWSPFEGKKIFDKNYHLNIAKKIAEDKGGKLISTEYTNVKTLLEFEDSKGRIFFKSYQSIINGVWTPFENKKKKNELYYLSQMQRIAESKGGKLLSKHCEGTESILEFEDVNKNIFRKKYSSVIQGSWSPFKITPKKAKAINDFKDIVKMKGGKLISKEEDYINSTTKLEIESKDGIRFYRSLDELKKDRWLKFYNKLK